MREIIHGHVRVYVAPQFCGVTSRFLPYDLVARRRFENVGYSIVITTCSPYLNSATYRYRRSTNYLAILHRIFERHRTHAGFDRRHHRRRPERRFTRGSEYFVLVRREFTPSRPAAALSVRPRRERPLVRATRLRGARCSRYHWSTQR
jgi:hypothetical protein